MGVVFRTVAWTMCIFKRATPAIGRAGYNDFDCGEITPFSEKNVCNVWRRALSLLSFLVQLYRTERYEFP